jgi:hypothetical protein
MIEDRDLQHAQSAVEALVTNDVGDPRLSRMQFVQAAQRIKAITSTNRDASDALQRLHQAVHDQVIDQDCVDVAGRLGWPRISGVAETPASFVYTIGRLYAHSALIRPDFAANFWSLTDPSNARNFAAAVDAQIAAFEQGFASGIMKAGAETASQSRDFSERLSQASYDVLALVRSGELPTLTQFMYDPGGTNEITKGSTTSSVEIANSISLPASLSWRLSRGDPSLWGNEPTDGDEGGSSVQHGDLCTIPSGSTGSDVACVVILVLVVILIIVGK